jgi:putative transposase
VLELAGLTGVRRACALLGRSRATHYRHQQPSHQHSSNPVGGNDNHPRLRRRSPSNALSAAERERVLQVLHCDRFADKAPEQVWATLLDEGVYLCSPSTMYRLLAQHGEVRERRRQARHPAKVKPELIAEAPNEVWSWDITRLPGPTRGVYYELFVMLDIYSRYVVGWQVHVAETGELAEAFIAEAIAHHRVPQAIHADRGASMTSTPVATLLADLGVRRSHSRPRVSNDNPYSEAQFRTLKYCPAFPERFGSLADARLFCHRFFTYYNTVHRHSGIGLHTPASVHYGTVENVRQTRAAVLNAAYEAHPNRFGAPPRPPSVPEAAWINPPPPNPNTQAA